MSYVSFLDRFRLAEVQERKPNGELVVTNAVMGRVAIDEAKCTGCRLCVKACPAHALEMDGPKNVRMIGEFAACVACSDCVAICHTDAIALTRGMSYAGLYKHIGRGELTPPRRF